MEKPSSTLEIASKVMELGTELVQLLSGEQSIDVLFSKLYLGGANVERWQRVDQSLHDLSAQLGHGDSLSNQSRLLFACDVLAADMCLRLDLTTNDMSSQQAQKVWSSDAVSALVDRLSWLRDEVQKSEDDQSRVLWTGPGRQDQQRSTNHLEEQGALLTAQRSRQIDPKLKSDVEQALKNEDKTELLRETFLESLAFPSMLDREEEVSAAHQRTFEWILASDEKSASTKHDFVPWLQRSDRGQMYWINGKAGSGKSTLLRFIAQHKNTKIYLRQWAANAPLIVVKFFFWTGGSILQRSHTGLLRSLLYPLLQKRPDLTAWAFPELWITCQDTKKRVSALKSWNRAALIKGFHNVLDLASKDSRICFFIDGLDEFEGRENAVIELVRDIVDISPNIKACVSSRPWPAFEKAFLNVPQILLQELTGADIEQYVADQLRDHPATRNMLSCASDNELQRLKAIVLKQANGVFLWASLALQRVAHGNNDTTETLSKALLTLPSDLNDLFRHLLFHQRNEMTLSAQSHALQILRARDAVCDFTGDDSVRSISLYQMALAFYGNIASTELPVQQCDQGRVLRQCSSFAESLSDKCAGLIVLSSHNATQARSRSRYQDKDRVETVANRRVHYLHRTVRDFFAYSGVWQDLVKHSNDAAFDPHLSLLKSHVLRLRAPLQKPEQHRRLDEWWHDDIVLAMTHARFAAANTVVTQVILLNRLDATLSWYWRKRGNDPLDTWARHAFSSYEERNKHKTPFCHAFLSLAAKFGLAEYLRSKLVSSDDFGYQAGLPLLTHALEFLVSRRQTVYPLSSPEVMRVLLEAGEDPNQQYKTLKAQDETPWLLAIKNVREGKRRGWIKPFDIHPTGISRWTRILQTMLNFKADSEAVILKDKWDPETTVRAVIENVADTYFAADLRSLKSSIS